MNPSKIRRSKVFVSYSHKDSDWIEPLRDHLSSLGKSTVWIDADAIEPGETWDQEIEKGLGTARVAVLLISASFLASSYISEKELPYLLEAAQDEKVVLLPIYLLPCAVPPTLAAYQAINTPDLTLADLKDDPAEQARVWMKAGQQIDTVLFELILVTVAREDLEQVEPVLEALEAMGLSLDLEVYERADDPALQARVRGKLAKRQASLLMIGERGLGLWQAEAMHQALRAEREARLATASDRRLLVAVLPGAPDELELPTFLPDNTRIRFPRGLDDAATLDRLWMGLTGKWKPAARTQAVVEPSSEAADLPGTTAVEPVTAEPAAPTDTEAAEAAAVSVEITGLVELMSTDNLTLFLGGDLVENHRSPAEDRPPRLFELTRGLLDELELPGFERLLLPFDLASSYFAVRNGERRLEFKLREMVSRGTELTSTHLQIARLLRTLLDLEPRWSRRGRQPARLIVTTNIDLLMERALLAAEVPFVRLVQERTGQKIIVNEYPEISAEGNERLTLRSDDDEIRVRHDDLDEICAAISDFGKEEIRYRAGSRGDAAQNALRVLPLERYRPRTFLYKIHGSEDVQRSCAVSIDQHFRLLKTMLEKNIVPLKITEYLSSGPLLVFGYGFLDPPFRVLLHTLPIAGRADFDDERQLYFFQLPPEKDHPDDFRRLEEQLWPKIKDQARNAGIEIVEKRGDHVLGELIDRLRTRFGEP